MCICIHVFCCRFDLEQVAPFEEGGGAGVFGIYKTDKAFEEIKEFTNLVMSMNTKQNYNCPYAGAPKNYPAAVCQHSWVHDTAGTGFEGVSCDMDINECVRGTDNCPRLSGCINLEGSFE